jgi:hypothetical protein
MASNQSTWGEKKQSSKAAKQQSIKYELRYPKGALIVTPLPIVGLCVEEIFVITLQLQRGFPSIMYYKNLLYHLPEPSPS